MLNTPEYFEKICLIQKVTDDIQLKFYFFWKDICKILCMSIQICFLKFVFVIWRYISEWIYLQKLIPYDITALVSLIPLAPSSFFIYIFFQDFPATCNRTKCLYNNILIMFPFKLWVQDYFKKSGRVYQVIIMREIIFNASTTQKKGRNDAFEILYIQCKIIIEKPLVYSI